MLEDEIDRLRPRLVIVSIYAGNDFGDLLRDKIYKLDERKQLKDNHYTMAPSFDQLFCRHQARFPLLQCQTVAESLEVHGGNARLLHFKKHREKRRGIPGSVAPQKAGQNMRNTSLKKTTMCGIYLKTTMMRTSA